MENKTVTKENIQALQSEIREFVSKAMVKGAFSVAGMHFGEAHIECLGFYFWLMMNHKEKSVSELPGQPISLYALSNENRTIIYEKIMAGGVDQAIKAKQAEMETIKKELAILEGLK